jgi:pimeloyl-ACP methyl ester carboxylesterase
MADDIAGLLERLSVDKCALAGHSMGGYIALAFAKKYPNRVDGLGLVSSQTKADTLERKQGRYKEAAEVEKNGIGSIVDGMVPKLSADIRVQARVREVMTRQQGAGVVGALKAMAERRDAADVLSSIQLPPLILHGVEDRLIPIERAREIKRDLPFVRLVELPDAGHMPMMEAPEKTAEALKLL